MPATLAEAKHRWATHTKACMKFKPTSIEWQEQANGVILLIHGSPEKLPLCLLFQKDEHQTIFAQIL